MMRLRRASVIAMLSLLACAATASAECAWVMWQSSMLPSTAEEVWSPLGAFSRESGGETTCESSADKLRKRSEQDARSKRLSTSFTCLPDTVDPRRPKGKH